MSKIDLYPDSNFPFLVPPLRDCLTARAPCMMGLARQNTTTYWNEISDYFCFLALPVILTSALLSEIMSIIVLTRQVRRSLDIYLLALSVAIFLLLIFTIILVLQHYVGPHIILVHLQPYIVSCRDWFWYSTIWLLILMSFERALTLSASKAITLCTSVQAVIVVMMVFAVGFVSSLPRFWEYQSSEILDPTTNVSILIAKKTLATTTEEYNKLYFWYIKGVTIFVPFTMMLIMCMIMACRTRPQVLKKRFMLIKQSRGFKMNRKIKKEIAHSHLLILLMALYVICSSPSGTLDLIVHLAPTWVNPESRSYASLYNLLTVLFFFQFVLHLIIYFSLNKYFRIHFISLFCRCC